MIFSKMYCIITDCGPLPTVSNVSLHMTSTTEGSDAHYVCNTGFYTTDKSTAACRLDGKWSLNSPPLCLLPTQGENLKSFDFNI